MGLLGRQIGRRQNGLNTLAFTSALMCLYNPFYLWDLSFQLSFMATLGLVLYAGPLQQGFLRLVRRRLPENLAIRVAETVGEFFLFTLAAQLTTLSLMAFHFGQVSWIAFLANPLVLPPQPLVMVLGGLAVLLSWVWFPLGQALAALAWPFVAYTIRMVEWWGSIPHGALTWAPRMAACTCWLSTAARTALF
ncbi:MAG TPA: ComEC/Rec2 family competence protein [Anaerolineaceae bacterium]|nr:ComEC/Rec2 family competence protein [Anaerolineaceae bacterium]